MFNTKPFKLAAKKFKTLGQLAVLASDHKAIGSTPPKELLKNPKKTLGQLMTDEQIAEWIKRNEETIVQLSEADQNSSFIKSVLPALKKELELGKKYLESIGKL